MPHYKLEYIWLDGYEPVEPSWQDEGGRVRRLSDPRRAPAVGLRRSSTEQAEGSDSDCMLKPVAVFPDATRTDGALVMCGHAPGQDPPRATRGRGLPMTPTRGSGSSRSTSSTRTRPAPGSRRPAVSRRRRAGTTPGSATRTSAASRARSPTRTWSSALRPGLSHEGINAESRGQWEFQIFAKGARQAGDAMWIARYLLMRACERYEVDVNFRRARSARVSTGTGPACIRTSRRSACAGRRRGLLRGTDGRVRSGAGRAHRGVRVGEPPAAHRAHETQSIDTFSYGVADRGASIRVPHCVANGYRGYLEDRRPNSQAGRTRSPGGSSRRSARCRCHRTARYTPRSRPSRPRPAA